MSGSLWFNASVVEWTGAALRDGTLLDNTATLKYQLYAGSADNETVGSAVGSLTTMDYEADGQFAGRVPNDLLTLGNYYWLQVTAQPAGGSVDERWEKRQCVYRGFGI